MPEMLSSIEMMENTAPARMRFIVPIMPPLMELNTLLDCILPPSSWSIWIGFDSNSLSKFMM